jgi:hypothetical protein
MPQSKHNLQSIRGISEIRGLLKPTYVQPNANYLSSFLYTLSLVGRFQRALRSCGFQPPFLPHSIVHGGWKPPLRPSAG